MMRKRWPILLIGLVWLASSACQGAPATITTSSVPAGPATAAAGLRAALERIRPQVFHQPYNASEQEVTDNPTSAGQGDRVRMPGDGKALLKWPDLYVMLYLRTELEAKDVTPNWIRLGILAGTTVTGGKLRPDQRLALYTDYAEITLSGTTVMVAYHPETRLTIVRVFEGQAAVRNLTGAPRVASVNGGEWALVGPGEAPQVSGDLTEMRGLARDLGLWDVFHEAESDVALGFGPQGSQVARSKVDIVFVTETSGPVSPSSEPPPAVPPAPAAQACRPGVLYCEDFEDGLAQGWELDAGWKLIQEGGNRFIAGTSHYWATLVDHSWEDYRVRFRLNLTQGAIHLVYRLKDGPTRYFFGFDQEGLSLSWQRGPAFSDGPVARVEARHALNRWHQVEIAGWGGRLQVYVDGKLELDYTDPNPLWSGTIAFETLDDSAAQVDDIEVLASGPPPAPVRPANTPVSTPKPPVSVRPTNTPIPTPKPPTPMPPTPMPATSVPPTSAPAPRPTVFVWCSPQQTSLELGQCTSLRWDAYNVSAVYLDGERVGEHAARDVCPNRTSTFTLRAVTESGDQLCQMSVEVTEPSSGLESGFDRPGMDLRSFWLAEADPDRCRRACLEDPQCQSFTYVRPGEQGEFAVCWIKSGVPDPVPNADCTSGVRGSAPVLAPAIPDLEYNTDRPGMDYKDFDIGNVDSCREECRQDVRCRAFTFQEDHYGGDPDSSAGIQHFTAHCWLKEGIPPRIEMPYLVSGAK